MFGGITCGRREREKAEERLRACLYVLCVCVRVFVRARCRANWDVGEKKWQNPRKLENLGCVDEYSDITGSHDTFIGPRIILLFYHTNEKNDTYSIFLSRPTSDTRDFVFLYNFEFGRVAYKCVLLYTYAHPILQIYFCSEYIQDGSKGINRLKRSTKCLVCTCV